jgi:type II secretory pathway pseudopilin PulG
MRHHLRLIKSPVRSRSGITKIEVTVVTAVVLGLAVLILPAIQAAREAARRSECKNHLRSLGLAYDNYYSTYDAFPYGCVGSEALPVDKRWSSVPSIGNYIMHYGIPEADLNLAWDDPAQRPYILHTWSNGPYEQYDIELVQPMHLICPSDPRTDRYYGQRHISYVGVLGIGPDAGFVERNDTRAGMWAYEAQTRRDDVADGLGHTLMFCESLSHTGCWLACGSATLRELDLNDQPHLSSTDKSRPFGSAHHGGGQGVLTDGSVRFISEEIDLQIFEALCTIAGKEEIPESW